MATPISSVVRVRHIGVDLLETGWQVSYDGRIWTVAEVLMFARPVNGFAVGVLGYDPATGAREILPFANRSAVAEVVS